MKDNQKMSFAGSPRKKIRGQKRRLNALLRRIDELQIPAGRDDVMKHLHVPSSQWIEMPKTSGKVKTEVSHALLELRKRKSSRGKRLELTMVSKFDTLKMVGLHFAVQDKAGPEDAEKPQMD